MIRFAGVASLLAALCVSVPASTLADDVGTAEEAIAMTRRAIELVRAEGTEKAFVAFRDASGAFRNKDLYVFCQDMKGTNQVHGANPAIIGKNMWNLKDSDSKMFIQEFTKTAQNSGGWVDYKWSNPTTKKIEPKSTYVEKVNDDLFCGVGIYKK